MAKSSARSRSSKKSRKTAKKSAGRPAKRPAKRSASKSTAKPAAKSSTQRPYALLFPDLESELSTTRRMLERVPNGNNDWRPHAKSRTIGELATHLAQLPGFGLVMATQSEFVGNPEGRKEATLVTSAERLRVFDDLAAKLKAVIQQMSWDEANANWTLRIGDIVAIRAPRTTVLRTAFVTHSAHHRAQLGVYLRMLDTPVPWSYGRSADEMPAGVP